MWLLSFCCQKIFIRFLTNILTLLYFEKLFIPIFPSINKIALENIYSTLFYSETFLVLLLKTLLVLTLVSIRLGYFLSLIPVYSESNTKIIMVIFFLEIFKTWTFFTWFYYCNNSLLNFVVSGFTWVEWLRGCMGTWVAWIKKLRWVSFKIILFRQSKIWDESKILLESEYKCK